MTMDVRSTRRGGPRVPRRVVPPERSPQFASQHAWLRMSSSGWYLHVEDVLAEPALTELISADACWLIAYQDWANRRPRRSPGRAWRSWRKEEAVLAVEQDALVRATFARPSLRPQSSS
jgi:hypothetical protein